MTIQEHPNAEPFRPERPHFNVAAAKLDAHLTESIAVYSKNPVTKDKPAMRGMNRLAILAHSVFDDLDKRADAAADRIVAGQQVAVDAITQFENFATSIETTASETLAALGQISNMAPPTPASGA